MIIDPLYRNPPKMRIESTRYACRGWSFDGFYYTWERSPPKGSSRYSRWPDYEEPHIGLRLSLSLPCNGAGGVVE